MAQEVTRTFDILDRYLTEFPRKDALGGKKMEVGTPIQHRNMLRNRTSLQWD